LDFCRISLRGKKLPPGADDFTSFLRAYIAGGPEAQVFCEQTCAASRELKQWCERNKDRCYFPEWLLKRWKMFVDPDSSG